MTYDDTCDAVGLLCPLPVLRARKRLLGMETGQILKLIADDPAAIIDVPHFCAEAGHVFFGSEDVENATAYFIKRGEK
ncbi:MAG: sulfurtransferase TusA family protein [Halocynthiibacter sp.]